MAELATKDVSAKEAVSIAFEVFSEFFDDTPATYVLLDGVKFDEARKEWIVSIGFDIGRRSKTSGNNFLSEDTETPIRERRHIHVTPEGEFVKME